MWTYDDAIEYLYSFIDYEVKREVRYAPEVMSLDRTRMLLAALGNPQDAYPIIHITGTKGKGSVGAYCQGILQAAGLRTGLYSSPHLQDFRERFRINDTFIDKPTITKFIAEMKCAADEIPGLTWFELTTAIVFMYFAEQQVDAAILEVGLGGRLDATNVVTPVVSVITSLSFDHTHLLGSTLAEIAAEKGGIIKPNVPVVSAPQPSEALDVLEAISAERHAPLTLVGRDWLMEPGRTELRGQAFQAGYPGNMAEYWAPLPGHHQAINGTVALAALHVFRASTGLSIDIAADGILKANWPGRFEVVSSNPHIILDAAHNGASARHLCATLDAVLPRQDDRTRVLIFGASQDKDITRMFQYMLPTFDHVFMVKAVHPRAISTDALIATAEEQAHNGVTLHAVPVFADALEQARAVAGVCGTIVVTGSLFVVGEARDVLGLEPGKAYHRVSDATVLSQECGDR